MILHTRTLGAHLDTSQLRARRMQTAAADAMRVHMRIRDTALRKRVTPGKLLPKGLCGCEATPVNATHLSKLRTELADGAVGTRLAKARAPELALLLYGGDMILEPEVHILLARATLLRRQLHLSPHLARDVKEIWYLYAMRQQPGSVTTEQALAAAHLEPMQPAGLGCRDPRGKASKAYGPVGLLLHSP